jgi:hypothetical protein
MAPTRSLASMAGDRTTRHWCKPVGVHDRRDRQSIFSDVRAVWLIQRPSWLPESRPMASAKHSKGCQCKFINRLMVEDVAVNWSQRAARFTTIGNGLIPRRVAGRAMDCGD